MNQVSILRQKHPFHIVDNSVWPLVGGFSAFFMVSGLVAYMQFFERGIFLFLFGFVSLLITAAFWWRDVIREATFEGSLLHAVENGLKMGMILFILSEIMLFFAFFWSFFHSSLNPVPEIGCVWPPKGIEAINAFHVPLLNTFVLLNSGAFVTVVHYSVLSGYRRQAITSFVYTIGLALFFTFLQYYEYRNALFNISDGIYGSTFYMITGLHGSHVLIGTFFLMVCLYRLIVHQFTPKNHFGLEAAIWYWHFVDIVWIFVYIFIYWWGGA